jgi:uncharacterized protein (UPF0332 family)
VDERIRAYARLRLERAREELETVHEMIAHNHFRAAVSRSYYAIFYMASAALFTRSIQRSKHSGVESAFSEFLVKPGRIEAEFAAIYQQVRRRRENADYDDSFVDEMTA